MVSALVSGQPMAGLLEASEEPHTHGLHLRRGGAKNAPGHRRRYSHRTARFRREWQISLLRFQSERGHERIRLGRVERLAGAAIGLPATACDGFASRRSTAPAAEQRSESGGEA